MTPTQLADARGIARPGVYDAEKAGPNISVGALVRLAEAAGLHLKILVQKKST